MAKQWYVVLGGQYEWAFYGAYTSLQAAKVAATKNAEYWDNWQGWHVPAIYKSEDCKQIETHGWITYHDYQKILIPKDEYSRPYLVKVGRKWEEVERR